MAKPARERILKPAGPAPDAAALRAAALAHLARYAATETGLRRVLERRIARWAHAAGAAEGADLATIAATAAGSRALAATTARRLVEAGAVDDAAFATARAARLRRAGKSRRAIAAHLGAKGVAAEAAATIVPEDEAAEVDAALAWLRRRRAGPFAPSGLPEGAQNGADPALARKALAALARAGYGHAAAADALRMEPAVATERLAARRRG